MRTGGGKPSGGKLLASASPSSVVGAAYEAIPGEDGWPLVGSIPAFTRDPLGFLTRLRREHGRVARFRMANLPYVLLSDPEGIRRVLVRDHDRFEKHEFLRFTLGDALGDGMLVAEGEDWLDRRQLAQPDFRPKRIREYAPTMAEQTQRIARSWSQEPDRRLHEDMALLTLRIAAETLFDVSVDAHAEAIGEALADVMARFSARNRLLSLVPKSVPIPTNRRYHRGVERIHAIVEQLVDDRLSDPTPDREAGDLMSRLIRASRARGAP